MTKVCVAVRTDNFNSDHTVTRIAMLANAILSERHPKAGPAGPRVVFGIGVEQLQTTAGTSVDTLVLVVRVRTRKGALSTLITRHLIGERRQSGSQFGIRRNGLTHVPIMTCRPTPASGSGGRHQLSQQLVKSPDKLSGICDGPGFGQFGLVINEQ
jgi:hypothetical protein